MESSPAKAAKVSSGDRKVPSSITNAHDKRIASSIASTATDANIVVYRNAWHSACPEMVNTSTPVFSLFKKKPGSLSIDDMCVGRISGGCKGPRAGGQSSQNFPKRDDPNGRIFFFLFKCRSRLQVWANHRRLHLTRSMDLLLSHNERRYARHTHTMCVYHPKRKGQAKGMNG